MSAKHWIARILLPYSLWLARLVFPTRSVVVVHGFPGAEGNAVETVRALASRYPGAIYWLDSPGVEYATKVGIPGSPRLHHVERMSLRALAAFIVAEATFFTHGLYGYPPRVSRKPTINVWHGEAIKSFFPLVPDRRTRGGLSDIHVGSTRRLGPAMVAASGDPSPRLILTGYPRGDQMRRPCSDEDLVSLGIDPTHQFVMWVPTFRQTAAVSATPTWSDTSDPDRDVELSELMSQFAQRFEAAGVQLVVKPHPLDRLSRKGAGIRSIDDARLVASGVPFYSLLGRSHGLITDFSSIANEYLSLDAPIAYFFPDKDAYAARRGIFPPDALDHLLGRVLETPSDVDDFIAEVNTGGATTVDIRARGRAWFGTVDLPNAADRMLSEVAAVCSQSSFGRRLQSRLEPSNAQVAAR